MTVTFFLNSIRTGCTSLTQINLCVPLKIKVNFENYSLLQTVMDNKTHFSSHEINRANTSRQIQENLEFPGPYTFKNYIKNSLVNNCEIATDDINQAECIYGP